MSGDSAGRDGDVPAATSEGRSAAGAIGEAGGALEKSEGPDAAAGQERSPAGRKSLGVFVLAMINVAAVLSIRNFPSMAEYGWASVTWYALGTLLFLLPLSLVGAELASAWPKSTGVYDWVTTGFGKRSGFLAIWSEWVENVVWFPTVLSVLAATLAYVVAPGLADNKIFLVLSMLGTFWAVTLVNFLGDKWSGGVSSFGTIAGSIIPSAVLIIMAVGWLISGKPLEISWEGPKSLLPEVSGFSTLALVASVVLMFAGMEMAGYHALETKNPRRDFPRAMFISAAIIFLLTTLGTLAIAFIIPPSEVNLVSGVPDAFDRFYAHLGIRWASRPTAVLLFVGGIALLSTWIIGPAKGMRGPARDGLLPRMWQRQNRRGVPVGTVILQGAVASLLSLLFLFIPAVNGAYWILSTLTTQIIGVMYILIFMAAVRLRYTKPEQERPYRVPGGTAGMWICAGAGVLSTGFAFVIGFFPPSQITTISRGAFPFVIAGGLVLMSLPAFLFYLFRKPAWLGGANAPDFGDNTSELGNSGDGDT